MSGVQLARVCAACLMVGALAFPLIACSVWTDRGLYRGRYARALVASGFAIVGALIFALGAAVFLATSDA